MRNLLFLCENISVYLHNANDHCSRVIDYTNLYIPAHSKRPTEFKYIRNVYVFWIEIIGFWNLHYMNCVSDIPYGSQLHLARNNRFLYRMTNVKILYSLCVWIFSYSCGMNEKHKTQRWVFSMQFILYLLQSILGY